jgi:hypothetical protein
MIYVKYSAECGKCVVCPVRRDFAEAERVENCMKRGICQIWQRLLLAGMLGGLFTIPAIAQIPPPPTPPSSQNQPQPNPQPAAQQVGPTGGLTTVPAQPTSALPSMTGSSSIGKSFGTAGRGLPGMPGGPALNGAMGAQDPSSTFMRPPTIGPLFCDPALNIPCD